MLGLPFYINYVLNYIELCFPLINYGDIETENDDVVKLTITSTTMTITIKRASGIMEVSGSISILDRVRNLLWTNDSVITIPPTLGVTIKMFIGRSTSVEGWNLQKNQIPTWAILPIRTLMMAHQHSVLNELSE